jgi:alpha-mannosidase
MLHKTVLKNLNMKNIEWDVYVNVTYDCSKWIWKILSEVGVYVNVTYDCSESEYEKHWVR